MYRIYMPVIDRSLSDCRYTKSMLLCKIAKGRCYETSSNMDHLNGAAPDGFNSIQGKQSDLGPLNYDELVVYEEGAIYPYAIVSYTYEKKPPAVCAVGGWQQPAAVAVAPQGQSAPEETGVPPMGGGGSSFGFINAASGGDALVPPRTDSGSSTGSAFGFVNSAADDPQNSYAFDFTDPTITLCDPTMLSTGSTGSMGSTGSAHSWDTPQPIAELAPARVSNDDLASFHANLGMHNASSAPGPFMLSMPGTPQRLSVGQEDQYTLPQGISTSLSLPSLALPAVSASASGASASGLPVEGDLMAMFSPAPRRSPPTAQPGQVSFGFQPEPELDAAAAEDDLVTVYLTSVGLGAYAAQMIHNGYDEVDDLKELSFEDLQSLCNPFAKKVSLPAGGGSEPASPGALAEDSSGQWLTGGSGTFGDAAPADAERLHGQRQRLLSDPSRTSGEKTYIVVPTNAYMRHPSDRHVLIPGTIYLSKDNLTFRAEAAPGRADINAKCPRSQVLQVSKSDGFCI